MFGVLFYLLFVLLISDHYYLDVLLFEEIQEYEEKTLSRSKREARQLTLDHIDPMPYTIRICVHTWLVMLSLQS
jgi:hypothetical protein